MIIDTSKIFSNWKTTSTGLVMIVGSITHLVFMIRANTADENTWNTTFAAILGGVGLILAGDAGASVEKSSVHTDAGTGFIKNNPNTPPIPTPIPTKP